MELGAGWGHIGKIQPLITCLLGLGHRVALATPQFDVARKLVSDQNIDLVATPDLGARVNRLEILRNFADVLHNTCFNSAEQVVARTASWLALYKAVQPDVIVCEHAPTALLAGMVFNAKLIAFGTGFSLPDAVERMPDWRPELGAPGFQQMESEGRVLGLINDWLERQGQAPFDYVSDLYHKADAQILGTRPEIDCFAPRRSEATYFDVWPADGGEIPHWRKRGNRRILAYIKPFPGLARLLQEVEELDASAIVICPGMHRDLKRRFKDKLAIVDRPLELPTAASQCDLAIGHGSHGFTVELMLNGKPQLLIPLNLEQRLTAERIQKSGAGVLAYDRVQGAITQALRELWSQTSYASSASQLQMICESNPLNTTDDALKIILE